MRYTFISFLLPLFFYCFSVTIEHSQSEDKEKILRKIKNTYNNCKSYVDFGTLVGTEKKYNHTHTTWEGNHKLFINKKERKVKIKYSHGLGGMEPLEYTVLWIDGKQAIECRNKKYDSKNTTKKDIVQGINFASPVLNFLFLYENILPNLLLDDLNIKVSSTEYKGVECYKLSITYPPPKVEPIQFNDGINIPDDNSKIGDILEEYWFRKDNCLLIRRQSISHYTNESGERVKTYTYNNYFNPKIDVNIVPNTFEW